MNKELTVFESRISFRKTRLPGVKKPVFYASVYWGDQLHEVYKYTKELCIEALKIKAGVKE
ncbi:MAG: hypothetical protein LBQ74_14165 [Prevotella sp.]|jgi:hypothetical protein|nr:hypothetical protein [Prevotella sp.]